MKNLKLNKARANKNDEFYTLYEDIEKEIKHYDKDNFKDKIIYCNCDDYRFSNFVKFFKDNFKELGLKGLISTNYNIGQGSFYYAYNGEKEVIKEIENGSFDSEFCLALLEKSDLIITNPPFSLFRKYIDLLISKDKKFLVIGSLNAVTYKNVFLYIKQKNILTNHPIGRFYDKHGNNIKFGNIYWYTNIDFERKKIILHETFSKEKYNTYDNFEAIEVKKVKDIPNNYNGLMGVPITFLLFFDTNDYSIIDLKTPFINNKITYKRIIIKRKTP